MSTEPERRLQLAPKLPPGTAGTPVKLVANLVRLACPDTDVCVYNVSFDPEVRNASARYEIFAGAVAGDRALAGAHYDGSKLLYATRDVLAGRGALHVDVRDPKFGPDDEPAAAPETAGAGAGAGKARPGAKRADKVVAMAAPAPAPAAVPEGASAGSGATSGKRRFTVRVTVRRSDSLPSVPLGDIAAFVRAWAARKPGDAAAADTDQPPLRYPGPAMQAADVMVRALLAAATRDPVRVNGAVFSLAKQAAAQVGGGVALWRGALAAPRACGGGLSLVVDAAHVDLVKPQPLLAMLREAFGNPRTGESAPTADIARRSAAELLRVCGRLRVETVHRIRRRYTVLDFGAPAGKCMFELRDRPGVRVSVAAYFKDKYPEVKVDPTLPVALVQKGLAIPIEALTILRGQRPVAELSAAQRTAVLDATCAHPLERVKACAAAAAEAAHACTPGGFKVGAELLAVPGRVLPAPAVRMRAKLVVVKNGVWFPFTEARGGGKHALHGFALPAAEIKRPLLVHCAGPRVADADVKRVLDGVRDMCAGNGLKIASIATRVEARSAAEAEERLHALVKLPEDKRPDFVFAVCSGAGDPCYASIKRVCEGVLGIPSQCFDGGKVSKENKSGPAYCMNVALKVNAKTGGVNHTAHTGAGVGAGVGAGADAGLPALLKGRTTLVLGADVYHDGGGAGAGAGDDETPVYSHSAVVGSLDGAATRYGGIVQQQGRREECIPGGNMQKVADFHILAFAAENKRLPQRIVYLRDGLGDSQLARAVDVEVRAIYDACTAIGEKHKMLYRPEIVFVTAVKRHHLRFFPQGAADADEKTGNVKSGTVVDSPLATRPDLSEFFLFAHPGLKGTSRPCLYQVVHTAAEGWEAPSAAVTLAAVQELGFYLSHLHQRASRAVSLPAPVYYAHVLAYRARLFNGRYAARKSDANADGSWGIRPLRSLYGKPYYL